MNGKILIIGKDGQLGRALLAQLGNASIALGRSECDLRAPDFTAQLESSINQPISAVINASAYTQVDKAESTGHEEAMRVNGQAVGELAAWCKKHSLPFVHFSTDYVFDGNGTTPYREDDVTAPINAYGASKLAGEQAVFAQGGGFLIFRTSWVYDAKGANFCTRMLSLFKEKEHLNVVCDQTGAPTYAPHLAQAALLALKHAQAMPTFPSGLYHLCNQGEVNRYDFAGTLLTLARKYDSTLLCERIDPAPTSAFPLPAARPLNSRLDCARAREMLGIELPHWQAGLNECIGKIYANK